MSELKKCSICNGQFEKLIDDDQCQECWDLNVEYNDTLTRIREEWEQKQKEAYQSYQISIEARKMSSHFYVSPYGKIGYYNPLTREVGVFVERWNDYMKFGIDRIDVDRNSINAIKTWAYNEYLRKNNLPR